MRKRTLVEIQKECERGKSFKCKRLELEEDKVRVEDKPFFGPKLWICMLS